MKAVVMVLAAALVSASCGWFEDPRPNEARLVVDGEGGKPVRLIVSTKFVASVNEGGQTRIVLFQADTIVTTLPIDRRVTIGGDERFYAETARLDSDLTTVRMQVFLDRKKEFDEDGPLVTGQPYRFVYSFNQQITRDIVVI